MKIKSIRLEELTQLVALKYCQLNTSNGVEILPSGHDSLSQEMIKIDHYMPEEYRLKLIYIEKKNR